MSEAIIRIPDDLREAGYRPFPGDAVVQIKRFTQFIVGRADALPLTPGIYEDFTRVLVERNGILANIDLNHLEDRHNTGTLPWYRRNKELCRCARRNPLPNTAFWEGDIVRVPERIPAGFPLKGTTGSVLFITKINYDLCLSPNRKLPPIHQREIYRVGHVVGCDAGMWMSEEMITLVERGNIWKLFNNVSLPQLSEEEVAHLLQLTGQFTCIPSPENGTNDWSSRDQAVHGIKKDVADGFHLISGFYGNKPWIQLVRYLDREFGSRIREQTLRGILNT